jgi:hypothetical protein
MSGDVGAGATRASVALASRLVTSPDCPPGMLDVRQRTANQFFFLKTLYLTTMPCTTITTLSYFAVFTLSYFVDHFCDACIITSKFFTFVLWPIDGSSTNNIGNA